MMKGLTKIIICPHTTNQLTDNFVKLERQLEALSKACLGNTKS